MTATNTGAERFISIGHDARGIFNREKGRSTPKGLWLYSRTESGALDRKGSKWTLDKPANELMGSPAYRCEAYRYDRNRSVSTTYFVWDDYKVDGYLKPGTYRFSVPVRVYRASTAADRRYETTDPLAAFDWGVSLSVSRP